MSNTTHDDCSSHEVLLGITTHGAQKGKPVDVLRKGAELWGLEDGGPGHDNVQVFIRAARAVGIELPKGVRFFHAAQIFYRDQQIEEVRLEFVVRPEPPPDQSTESILLEHRTTPTPPQFSFDKAENLRLAKKDAGRTHVTAVVVLSPDATGPSVAFLWDLCENAPLGKLDSCTMELHGAEDHLVSVMSPVPVPRAAIKGSSSLALTRGLGRMFAGYNNIPDLGRSGEIAIVEAETLFWTTMERFLDGADVQWDKQSSPDGKTTLILYGIQVNQAKEIWQQAVQAMTKGKSGPGLKVVAPDFVNGNHHEDGQTNVETHILLWPDGNAKNRSEERTPPVQFRSRTSPGYTTLLKRYGSRPFFADGWLCIWAGHEWEGFRIGGLSSLLFPEGRDALERIQRQCIDDRQAELNRILQEPSRFQDDDERVVRELQQSVRRAQQFIARLSTYDCHDLILCIFEAFHRQRDAWAREELILPGGRVVSTKPCGRFIRIDAEELRLRLDPDHKWGHNWRNKLMDRFRALATFERTTWGEGGHRRDIGDHLVRRVLDSRGNWWDKSEEFLDRWEHFEKAGAFSDNAFYVELSYAMMEKFASFSLGETGVVAWGMHAVDVATDEQAKREAKLKAKSQPYYDHSPRLLAVGNLDGWPPERKMLADVLLQEETPNFERKPAGKGTSQTRRRKNSLGGRQKLCRIEGQDYVACNGKYDRGYRISTWIDKVGYEKGTSCNPPADAMRRYAGDLKVLSRPVDQGGLQLRLELKGKNWPTEEVQAFLEAKISSPGNLHGLVLKKYIPLDLEARLRERLEAAGIDALDDGDQPDDPRDRAASPGGLSPNEIFLLRQKAGWTQAELAEVVGVSQPNVSCWETGEKPVPPERLEQLREILGPHQQSSSS